MIRQSESRGANPLALLTHSGDGYRTQQEIPVATLVGTTHAFQFTTEELHVLSQAMNALLDRYRDEERTHPYDQGPEEWQSLLDSIERPLSFEKKSQRLEKSAEHWKQKCNRAKSKLQNLESPMIDAREILTLLH